MRRFAFYLSVALLAFGISSFVVFNFYWNDSALTDVKEQSSKAAQIQQNNVQKNLNSDFTCDDEPTNTIWRDLRKDKEFKDYTDNYVKEKQIKSCREFFGTVKTVDLNGDGFDEIIVQGKETLFCGSAGDCPTWIISKSSNQYKIIFNYFTAEADGKFFGLEILQNNTNKFSNLKTKVNNGMQEDNIGFLIFDGKKYKLRKCFIDMNSGGYSDNKSKERLLPVSSDNCL